MNIYDSVYNFLSSFYWLALIKKEIDKYERKLWRVKQVYRKKLRQKSLHLSHSYRFCILTVKRTVYVDLAIDQINSIHYYNPCHVFDILCDEVCFTYFSQKYSALDYPLNTHLIPFTTQVNGFWQRFKITALLYAVERDAVLIDADMFWYSDLLLRQWQALLFTKAYVLKTQQSESDLVKHVFHRPNWQEFAHFATGVVYVPYSLFSTKMKNDLVHFTQIMLADPFHFIKNQRQRDNLHRLTDEMAINLALQANLESRQITTLKVSDSPGDRHIVHSLYYGAMNSINS